MRSTLLLLAVALPAALLVACGSDTTTTGTTSGGGDAPITSSVSGTGGAGGSSGTTGAGGTGGSSSATTSTSTGTSSSASSTGTGMMAMGACTNAADGAILTTKDVKKIAEDCGKSSLGAEPATKNCIKMGTNLSDPCVTCFDDIVQCVVKNCFNDCFADPGSAACTACRDAKCNPAFKTCSGLPSN